MGCCESRESEGRFQRDSFSMEVRKSNSQLIVLEKGLQPLQEQLDSLKGQLDDFQTDVLERMELSRITLVLTKLEEATQAQFVSERHATHLMEDELLENIRFHQIHKAQNKLREWIDHTKSHLSTGFSILSLQNSQVALQKISAEIRATFETVQKHSRTLTSKVASSQSVEISSWKALEARLMQKCTKLLRIADDMHKILSSMIVKLQQALDEEELQQKCEEVQALLSLLQTEVKPLGRKSYKEITEEVLFCDPITRTSTADSISHFEQLFTKITLFQGPSMDSTELQQVASALLATVNLHLREYAQKPETFRPLELDVLEFFLKTYDTKAADKLRQFARALKRIETEDYASFVARALCFSHQKHLHFLPKLLSGLHGHDFNWKSGGLLQLQELLQLLEDWFHHEPETGAIITAEIANQTIGAAKFFTFYAQLKMNSTRCSAHEIFTEMDEEDTKSLKVEAFPQRLKARFEVFLAQDKDLEALGETLDFTKSGTIFRTEFEPAFSAKIDVPDVPCSVVIKAFEVAYNEILAHQAYELYHIFTEESGPDYRLTVDQVIPVLQRIRPTLMVDHIQQLASKAKLQQNGHLTFEEFRELVWRYNLKSTAGSYFDQQLFDLEHVKVSEEVMDLVASLS